MSARRSKRSADDAAEMESPPTSPTPDLSAEAPFLPFAERARQATPMRDKCESTAICIGQPSHPNSSATVGCPCRRPPSGALGGGGAPTRGAQSAEPHRQEGRGEGAGSRGCVPTTAPQPRAVATPRSKPETPRLLPSTQGGSPEAVRRSTPLPPAPEQSEPAPEDATRGGPWEEVRKPSMTLSAARSNAYTPAALCAPRPHSSMHVVRCETLRRADCTTGTLRRTRRQRWARPGQPAQRL